jgi:hypothetical protein
MNIPWVESPFFKEILNSKNLSDEYRNLALDYNENGFVVIPDLITDSLIEEVKLEMENKGYNLNFEMNNQRDNVRIQDLWMYAESVKKIACNPKVLEILEMLYGREPLPFQTLNFRVGTQQRAHSDTIHFSSIPAKFMCGVWVALEDITPENGAVFYYPKSQNLPEYNFSHFNEKPIDTSYDNYIAYEDFIERIVVANNFEKKPFYAKKGDVLIWSSNIIHGGSKVINEKSTRYSQVTHYYFKDCTFYTPMLSNMVTNELFLKNNLVDIKTGEKIKQSFNGNTLNYVEIDKNKFVLNNRIRFKKLTKIIRKLVFKK